MAEMFRAGTTPDHAHIRLLSDCAEICQTSAHFMLRGSDLHTQTCEVCATVCERCAEACAAIRDNTQMQRCEDACRRCANSCRAMAGGTQSAFEGIRRAA